MFAGIGGFRTGLTNAGDFFMPVGWCEKDKHAQKAYRLLYGTEGEYFCDDARIINPADLPDFDLICGGFPSGLPDMSALFLSQGNDLDLLTKEAHSFMKSALCESKAIGMKPGTLNIFCLRTCRGYSLTKGGKLSSLSSIDQNEERQMVEMRKLGIAEERIYKDKQSGKDFNRPMY